MNSIPKVVRVEFLIDGILVATDDKFPWDFNWDTGKNYDDDQHSIFVRAYDETGYSFGSASLVRISQNTQPLALFTFSPRSGHTETIFNFDAGASSDREEGTEQLRVRWDWEGDSIWDTDPSVIKTSTHQFTNMGIFAVKMEVQDSNGATSVQSQWITIDTIVAPKEVVSTELKKTDATITNEAKEVNDVQNIFDSKKITDSNATVTDIDGNVYRTVRIGNQVWMLENLKVTHYQNGDLIPNLTVSDDWISTNLGAYCNYDNSANKVNTYGRLYNHYAVEDGRSIAPAGWHVPTEEEWNALETNLGLSSSKTDEEDCRGTNTGEKLKSAAGWNNNGNGSNESGFAALPGGHRFNLSGNYTRMGDFGYFWSATDENDEKAWFRKLGSEYSCVFRLKFDKHYGFSVRCVKD